jgi:hypothetical protein
VPATSVLHSLASRDAVKNKYKLLQFLKINIYALMNAIMMPIVNPMSPNWDAREQQHPSSAEMIFTRPSRSTFNRRGSEK